MAKRAVAKRKNSVSVSSISPPKSKGLCEYAVAYTLAIIMAAKVLIVSILIRMGILPGAADLLDRALISWNLTISGILTGMAEVAICGLIVGYVGAWLYNKFA